MIEPLTTNVAIPVKMANTTDQLLQCRVATYVRGTYADLPNHPEELSRDADGDWYVEHVYELQPHTTYTNQLNVIVLYAECVLITLYVSYRHSATPVGTFDRGGVIELEVFKGDHRYL